MAKGPGKFEISFTPENGEKEVVDVFKYQVIKLVVDFFLLAEQTNLTICQDLTDNFITGLSVFEVFLILTFELNYCSYQESE